MIAHCPTFSKPMDRYLQKFTKQLGSICPSNSVTTLSTNDRVIISRQDGSAWALATGVITLIMPGPVVEVSLDKGVAFQADIVYRIDQVSGYSGGVAYSNLADLCVSDCER